MKKDWNIKRIITDLNKEQYFKLQFIFYTLDNDSDFDESDSNLFLNLIDLIYDSLKDQEQSEIPTLKSMLKKCILSKNLIL